jgi:pimeloyl-ACP methyl ester carboxylesterase
MAEPLPIVLVPGLLTSWRLYAEQLSALWQHGPVTIVGNTRDDTVAAIASRILADAPPRFALAGLSMGGYICFELARQAPDRVARLALLDTTARPDPPAHRWHARGQGFKSSQLHQAQRIFHSRSDRRLPAIPPE